MPTADRQLSAFRITPHSHYAHTSNLTHQALIVTHPTSQKYPLSQKKITKLGFLEYFI
jgi:hypothetical protein